VWCFFQLIYGLDSYPAKFGMMRPRTKQWDIARSAEMAKSDQSFFDYVLDPKEVKVPDCLLGFSRAAR
jgi:hypothetical protein